jgi:hypothetical protein
VKRLLDRPGNIEIQLDLFYDYRNNLATYPKIQAFLRDRQPPTLIVRGANSCKELVKKRASRAATGRSPSGTARRAPGRLRARPWQRRLGVLEPGARRPARGPDRAPQAR